MANETNHRLINTLIVLPIVATVFRCKDMKDKGSQSGIRIIYAYLPEQNKIEFTEFYYKEKDDLDCDKERIKNTISDNFNV